MTLSAGLPRGNVVQAFRRARFNAPFAHASSRDAGLVGSAAPACLLPEPTRNSIRVRRHSAPSLVANALADAMLAGLPTARAMRDRCAETLGRSYPWITAVVRSVLRRHGSAWHPNARDDVAATILSVRAFADAFHGDDPPQIRRYVFNAPRMSASAWAQPLAMPDIPAPGDLAAWLGLTIGELDWLADVRGLQRRTDAHPLSNYVRHVLAKRHGGWRLIESPKPRLRAIQRRLLDDVLSRVPQHEAAHGFRTGRSCVSHAAPHVGRAVVIRLDLSDFFLHVSAARAAGLFRSFGFPPAVSRVLAGLCTTRTPPAVFNRQTRESISAEALEQDWQTPQRYRTPHLPQGAPSSPALANLCAFALDMRLAALAQAAGASYTRYADDLVFSGGAELARRTEHLIARVSAIALEEGFAVNSRKTQVMPQARRQRVTGVVVNRRINVQRAAYDTLKATLHNCVRSGPLTQNRACVPDFRSHLAGRIAHVANLNPTRGACLRRLFESIHWPA